MTISSQLIVKTALATLETEAQTIAGLKNSIDEEFVAAVREISNCPGRIIVTGIGKSALIGRKIVATLNSTGTPSVFMHAADALHGDLGMIQDKDVIICLSKSGETAEIKALIPLLRQFGMRLIAMTARPHSYLAQQADHLLYTPIAREAEPNNLAPTASTVAQMAMGDALASALLATRGFAPSDFAKYHPAGALGKRLYLRVSDVCHHQDRPLVKTTATLRQTIVEMTTKRLGCTVVVDEKEVVQGIITDGDLRRMLEREGDVSHFTAADIMSPQPRHIEQSELATAALDLMSDWSISQLVVVDGEQYIGVIHLHDLVKAGL
ncbi:MAG: KpsF/GutQ family sugar-phosphate isomerase [Bacteroidota bacterium]